MMLISCVCVCVCVCAFQMRHAFQIRHLSPSSVLVFNSLPTSTFPYLSLSSIICPRLQCEKVCAREGWHNQTSHILASSVSVSSVCQVLGIARGARVCVISHVA